MLYHSVCTVTVALPSFMLSKLALDLFVDVEFPTFLHSLLIMGLVMRVNFFLVGRVNACSVETNAVCKLGEAYCSPVLFCELEVRCLFDISRDF